MAKRKTKKKKPAKKKSARGPGRPPKKASDHIDMSQLALLCQKGFTDRELAQFYGRAESTIGLWKNDPVFKEVLDRNKAVADDRVEAALLDRALGTTLKDMEGNEYKILPADVEAIKFWLINRRGKKWRIKQEIDIPGVIKIEYPYRKGKREKKR